MDRRLFVTGLLGLAGATALSGMTKPAVAGMPIHRQGILDELDQPEFEGVPEDPAEVEPAQYYYRHRRRRRRRVWRRVCRRYRRAGYWRRRCRRVRRWVYW
jgi:hypothetical protein